MHAMSAFYVCSEQFKLFCRQGCQVSAICPTQICTKWPADQGIRKGRCIFILYLSLCIEKEFTMVCVCVCMHACVWVCVHFTVSAIYPFFFKFYHCLLWLLSKLCNISYCRNGSVHLDAVSNSTMSAYVCRN